MKTISKILLTLLLLLSFNLISNHNKASAASNQTKITSSEIEDLISGLESLSSSEKESLINELESLTPNEIEVLTSIEPYAAFKHLPGDILYTKSTQCNDADVCKGLSGHTGIITPGGLLLHTQGKGYKPQLIAVSQWYEKYPATKVIRPNSSTEGQAAAKWALDFYWNGPGKNYEYRITGSPLIKHDGYTYCSKLVWQAYYFGAGKALLGGNPIQPKDFEQYASNNKHKVVYTVGW